MLWLAKTVNDPLSVVQTLRFQIVNKRFACVSLDKKNAIATVQELQLLFSYFWSYFSLFSLQWISCPLCNSNTLWKILIVLSRNVEKDDTMCHVQEWQICRSYFWRYSPLLYLTVIMHRFHVHSVSRIPFGIILIHGRNVEQEETTCCIQEWQLLLLELSIFVLFWNCFGVLVTQIQFLIFWWYLVEM